MFNLGFRLKTKLIITTMDEVNVPGDTARDLGLPRLLEFSLISLTQDLVVLHKSGICFHRYWNVNKVKVKV